ncbi:Uncharacterised protein [Vibrio cholerae]|nr:Uncharacterised protein [Vibrio cholerae]
MAIHLDLVDIDAFRDQVGHLVHKLSRFIALLLQLLHHSQTGQ